MHESVREGKPSAAPEGAPTDLPPSRLLDEMAAIAGAVKRLFGAQLHLLAAELGLARSAVSWMLLAGLVATIAGVGFGLTLLGLIGVLLAAWFGSWAWAMLVLTLLQLLTLFGAIMLFRRCMHWMSLPGTRHEWRAMVNETVSKAEQDTAAHRGEDDRAETTREHLQTHR
jgi:hypothetical protein